MQYRAIGTERRVAFRTDMQKRAGSNSTTFCTYC
jgi:hypothetical protein